MGGWKPWWTREASRTRFIAVPACLRTLFFPSFFLFFFYVQYRGILELFRSVLRVPEELATLRLPVSISLRPWIFPSESSLYIVPPDFSFAIFLQDFSRSERRELNRDHGDEENFVFLESFRGVVCRLYLDTAFTVGWILYIIDSTMEFYTGFYWVNIWVRLRVIFLFNSKMINMT